MSLLGMLCTVRGQVKRGNESIQMMLDEAASQGRRGRGGASGSHGRKKTKITSSQLGLRPDRKTTHIHTYTPEKMETNIRLPPK